MIMNETMNIAIALNNKVIVPAYVMLRSLVINNAENSICIYVLHSELTDENMMLLTDAAHYNTDRASVHFIKIDPDKTKGLPCNMFWSAEMYYRLMLPDLLGEQIDRILYLDIDMIINQNIYDFYNTDFEGKLLIAAKDVEFDHIISIDSPEARERNEFFRYLTTCGMTYFCSGMLLMNLEKMKGEYTYEKYMEIFESIRDKQILPDQDLLNYAHYKDVKLVDELKYGLFTQTAHKNGMTYDYVKNNVPILHFTGQAKPWTCNLIRYDIEKIWWEYAKTAPFYYSILEQVFFNMIDNTLTERKFDELIAENNELRQTINKCQKIIQRLT